MTEFLQSAQGIFTNLLAFAFALGVIIAVHEWGHLVVAKLFDVRVTAFSLGFGPRLWGFRRGETDYRLSLVPLGGYVKLGGEQPDEVTGDPREFLSKPRWQRVLVYLAGPAMNVVLAILLIAIVFMVGTSLPNLDVPPVVGGVAQGSSAAAAGVEPGDRIVRVGDDDVDTWDSASLYLMMAPERAVPLVLERDGRRVETVVTPERIPGESIGDLAGIRPKLHPAVTSVDQDSPAAAAGLRSGDELWAMDGRPVISDRAFVEYVTARAGQEIELEVVRDGKPVTTVVVPAEVGGAGRIGIGIGTFQRYGFLQAFVQSARYNWRLVEQTFAVLGKIFTRDVAAKDALAGPIEIAAYSGDAARVGFFYLLHLMGFISISIAIVNLLPIPILDGGQVVILLVESTMRRDLSLRIKEMVAQVGFVLIMLLMLTVIYFDLSKNLPGLIPG
ncbi:MAG TPA: RIP metalloprotease RseP [Thermoanaerobaculia bacterium]|nr:RIP metalloprotease RseP [Thermoanaerobaculia bacterium]